MFRHCPTCGKEALFTCEAVYEGFTKTGEAWICSVCGATQTQTSEAQEKPDPLAALFGDDARPEGLDLFDVEAETARSCRKCRHYVIHPFTQRCGLHGRDVAATDVCDDFSAAE